MELEKLVEESVLSCLENKLDQHSLLCRLDGNSVFEHTAKEFKEYCVDIPNFKWTSYWLGNFLQGAYRVVN